MATLYEYNVSFNNKLSVFSSKWHGQTFTPSEAHKITSVKLRICRVGSPWTTMVSIRATDASGHPTGPDLCSASFDGNTLVTYEESGHQGAWKEISLGAGADLSADTKYAICFRAEAGNADNYVYWMCKDSACDGGCRETSNDGGSSWTSYDWCFTFEDWGEPAVTAPTVSTVAATNVQATTARLNGQISDDGGEACQYRFRYKKSGGAYSYTTWTGAKTTGQTFYEDISGLDTGSLYYFNAQAKNSAGDSAWGGELSFTTKPAAPTNVQATDGVHTDKVVITWIKSTGATGYQVYRDGVGLGWLGDVATQDDTEAGAPTITPGAAVASDGEFADKVALSLSEQSVSNGTSHTYKVRARNATGESADSTTNTGYRGHGALTYQWQRSAGDSDASYSNIPGATTANYNDIGAPADGSGRYYRCVENATGAAQATSTADRGYRITSPTVTTQPVSNIGDIGATGNATITDDGGEACSERGVCWNTTGNPTTDDSKSAQIDSFGVGAFTKLMTGLTPGQKYYVKGYAINPAGTSYGGEVSFTTKPSAPSNLTATTISETQINLTWTKGASTVNTVIRRRVNTAPISPTDGVEVYNGPGTSHNDTTCSPGVHYFYRAWSYHPTSGYSDNYDTADSSTVVAPTGTTEAATLIGDVNTTLNGKVTDDGGEPCQVRFQYGTTTDYGTDTAWQTGKVTDDVFSQRITGLAPLTEYHFRAQINNSAGTANGVDRTFTTIELPTPFLRRVLRDVLGGGEDIDAGNPLPARDIEIKRTYRELKSQQDENWVECMFITKDEFNESFGTDYQVLDKIYAPVKISGLKTIALVSNKGFSGRTNTLLEITIDGAGDVPAATFKWRKKTFLGDTWGSYTEGAATGANIEVTDGIRIEFDDAGYEVGNQWHVQACGTWHTPESGVHSYLTSVFVYPFDATPVAKAGKFRFWRGDYRIVDYATSQGEFPNWRTPIHLLGDGAKKFKVELAEIGAGQIDSIFCVMKGWDE